MGTLLAITELPIAPSSHPDLGYTISTNFAFNTRLLLKTFDESLSPFIDNNLPCSVNVLPCFNDTLTNFDEHSARCFDSIVPCFDDTQPCSEDALPYLDALVCFGNRTPHL